jgi:hypothetical protein
MTGITANISLTASDATTSMLDSLLSQLQINSLADVNLQFFQRARQLR